MRGLITALQTLTILPIPFRGSDRFAASLPYFPLVGLFIGGLVSLAGYMVKSAGWSGGAGIIALGVSVLITRGLHMDGLADVVDALGGGHDRERRLSIMKDPHIGSFGVLALILACLIKTAALVSLLTLGAIPWIGVVFINARYAQVQLACSLPYARAEGGTAQGFVRDARPRHLIIAGALALALSMVAGGVQGLGIFMSVVLVCCLLGLWMRRVFGGVTGDLLGFTNEMVELFQFIVISILAVSTIF